MRVSVRDFGVGLPAEKEKIFEQFFSTKRDGLGMGLVIARSIVEAHGGRLSAENAEGGGAASILRFLRVVIRRHDPAWLPGFLVDDDPSVRRGTHPAAPFGRPFRRSLRFGGRVSCARTAHGPVVPDP